jgi:hypothetical protein
MISAQELTHLLREELVLQTQHCRHLEAQQRALLTCDRVAFRRLQQEYASLTARLEEQAKVRAAAMTDQSGQVLTLTAVLECIPEGKRFSLVSLRDTLRRTIERAQTLCRENERLIKNELNYFAFALELFVEAGKRADIAYGGGGTWGRRKLLDRRA